MTKEQLANLSAAFDAFRREEISATQLCTTAREQTALLQALPPRYAEVLDQLLDRLQSSALFTEDSCSFSQSDLQDNLQTWLEHAQRQLDRL